MSLTKLTKEAKEQGSYIVSATFKDEDDNNETPKAGTVTWTLTDSSGTVINSREDEAIAAAGTINIFLEGDDLQILSGETGEAVVDRRVLVKWEYDSDLGNNKPGTDEVIFPLRNLTKLS